jgi:hypothetical protein
MVLTSADAWWLRFAGALKNNTVLTTFNPCNNGIGDEGGRTK